jgi:cell division septal protein FtsQ
VLYLIDTDAVERENVLSKCPYLEKVEIESVFPNKIRFRVESIPGQSGI